MPNKNNRNKNRDGDCPAAAACFCGSDDQHCSKPGANPVTTPCVIYPIAPSKNQPCKYVAAGATAIPSGPNGTLQPGRGGLVCCLNK